MSNPASSTFTNQAASMIGNHVVSSINNQPVSEPGPGVAPPSEKLAKLYGTARWLGAVASLAAMVAGAWGIFSNIVGFSLSGVIVSIYLMPLGLVALLLQIKIIRYQWITNNFTIVKTDFGKGNYFIFTGGLCFASGVILGWVAGGIMIFFGLFYIFWSIKFKQPKLAIVTDLEAPNTKSLEMSQKATVASSTPSTGPSSSAGPAPIPSTATSIQIQETNPFITQKTEMNPYHNSNPYSIPETYHDVDSNSTVVYNIPTVSITNTKGYSGL